MILFDRTVVVSVDSIVSVVVVVVVVVVVEYQYCRNVK
jgi:hypothetical protein